MQYVLITLQLIVGLSLINVWLVQPKKKTRYRGGDAATIFEEFEVYGLPSWSLYLIGALKVLLGILLIAGIWVPGLRFPAAAGLGILLTGSILMHFKISDPLYKSFPAALFLLMCAIIAYFSYPM